MNRIFHFDTRGPWPVLIMGFQTWTLRTSYDAIEFAMSAPHNWSLAMLVKRFCHDR